MAAIKSYHVFPAVTLRVKVGRWSPRRTVCIILIIHEKTGLTYVLESCLSILLTTAAVVRTQP